MSFSFCFFFFNDTATTEIYTLSLHDALPISAVGVKVHGHGLQLAVGRHRAAQGGRVLAAEQDRKSTRLNSSHMSISYAVFCLKKKKKTSTNIVYCKKDLKIVYEIKISTTTEK